MEHVGPAPLRLSELAAVVEQRYATTLAPLGAALRSAAAVLPALSESQRESIVASAEVRPSLASPPSREVATQSASTRLVCGVPVRCRAGVAQRPAPTSLHLTSSTRSNLQSLALALSPWTWSARRGGAPVLVEGVAGCGKSSAVQFLAAACGFEDDLVVLQLDDAVDSKALLGSYVCAERPGEFRWLAGVVTEAAVAGRWVVIEDVDRASGEVLSALVSLMQSRTLHLPGRSDPLVAHPDFLLLGTRTTMHRAGSLRPESASPVIGPLSTVIHLWTRVLIAPLDAIANRPLPGSDSCSAVAAAAAHSELRAIVVSLHPHLADSCIDAMLQIYHVVLLAQSPRLQSGPSQSHWMRSFPSFGRAASPRDMLKFARRIVALTRVGSALAAAQAADALVAVRVTDADREQLLVEALDVFALHLPQQGVRKAVAGTFAAILGLGDAAAEEVLGRKPCLTCRAIDHLAPDATHASQKSSSSLALAVGRVHFEIQSSDAPVTGAIGDPLPPNFAPTRHGLRVLEAIAACVRMHEPALLVGETGSGKTTAVQVLAKLVGTQLVVLNLSMQTDSADLLGGYKPVHLRQLARPLVARFVDLFNRSFPSAANSAFSTAIDVAARSEDWSKLCRGFAKATRAALNAGPGSAPTHLLTEWSSLSVAVAAFERHCAALQPTRTADGRDNPPSREGAFAFSFVEGALVTAVRAGHWILLDEINLASADTLQRIAALLEGSSSRFQLPEGGGSIAPHPLFRLFGAMNPATDAGKRDLPPALRSRFTEVWVDEPSDPSDLACIVSRCLSHVPGLSDDGDSDEAVVPSIVKCYSGARALTAPLTGNALRDGSGGRPHYSIRSLTRALRVAADMMASGHPLQYAVMEGLTLCFAVQLEESSSAQLLSLFHGHLPKAAREAGHRHAVAAVANAAAAAAATAPPLAQATTPLAGSKRKKAAVTAAAADSLAIVASSTVAGLVGGGTTGVNFETHAVIEGVVVPLGPRTPVDRAVGDAATFILVPSVRRHLHNLARAVATKSRFPVLLQGPTSSGKTTIVEYLAAATGHECTRINNHEHTDLAEYLGTYVPDPATGRLVFTDGLLVRALRSGSWLILDELNLAPSDVLEALNRLLDDNRELFIPETQEVVRPHASFQLFATQNPAGLYGGRKELSLAFRNRFVELHVDDLPDSELETILCRRSRLPASFVRVMVSAMAELHRLRQTTNIFAGKHGFGTTRDLLRWASRQPDTYESLALHGYMLIAERLRDADEKAVVLGVIERHCKVKLVLEDVYASYCSRTVVPSALVGASGTSISSNATKRARGEASAAEAQSIELKLGGPAFASLPNDVLIARLAGKLSHLASQLLSTDDDAGHPDSRPDSDSSEALRDASMRSCARAYGLTTISLTHSLQRLYTIIVQCLVHDEPVLLVGDTGCGKTTVVQVLALLLGQPLLTVNCHAGTETADMLGSLRPARQRAAATTRFRADANAFLESFGHFKSVASVDDLSSALLSDSFSDSSADISDVLNRVLHLYSCVPDDNAEAKAAAQLRLRAIEQSYRSASALFEWVDGPLVTALRNGSFFLLDECSLAEDAVLERLNSVLEPSRTLTLAENSAERGEDAGPVISAARGFRFFATMNPGGDFGKRELSPALRNRFTEVWVPPVCDAADLLQIIRDKCVALTLCPRRRLLGTADSGPLLTSLTAVVPLPSSVDGDDSTAPVSWRTALVQEFCPLLVEFVLWFDAHASTGRLVLSMPSLQQAVLLDSECRRVARAVSEPPRARVLLITLRDLHRWIAFMAEIMLHNEDSSIVANNCGSVTLWQSYCHAACLVLLDGLGLGTGLAAASCVAIRNAAVCFLLDQAPTAERESLSKIFRQSPAVVDAVVQVQEKRSFSAQALGFGIEPFFIRFGPRAIPENCGYDYSFEAPTTRTNLLRVMRALQLPGPLLLEGSPGVGKSSLIEALARKSGHELVRINLSEQTDLADLFGQDLPVSSSSSDGAETGALFSWADGALLKAIKAGHWVLLDELNLATQPVLEGLNACLDHRASVYIPELGRSFSCPLSFRVFATQNPVVQGGGRRGLPKSFLNRFNKVYVEPLSTLDLAVIGQGMFPLLASTKVRMPNNIQAKTFMHSEASVLDLMIHFNGEMARDTSATSAKNSAGGHSDASESVFGMQGRPWDFNLRDLTRWCSVVERAVAAEQAAPPISLLSRALDTIYVQRFRTPADRAAVLGRFAAVFGQDALQTFELHDTPALRASPIAVSIDDVWLPRAISPGLWSLEVTSAADLSPQAPPPLEPLVAVLRAGGRAGIALPFNGTEAEDDSFDTLNLSPRLTRHLYHLMQAVRHSWPVLICGRAATGKTSSIVALARVSGAALRVLSVTTSSDATDLLGCFEQADPSRPWTALFSQVAALMRAASLSALRCIALSASSMHELQPLLAALDTAFVHIRALASAALSSHSTTGTPEFDVVSRTDAFSAAMRALLSLASACLRLALGDKPQHSSHPLYVLLESTCAKLRSRSDALQRSAGVSGRPASSAGRFEWVDGTLVQAMERGDWVLVENVNFCTPAVIDRLNAMLEPGGTLLLGECGLDAQGCSRTVVPHPSFRIFFTMNPEHGEVSRALRNRCVELYFDESVSASLAPLPPGGQHKDVRSALDRRVATTSVVTADDALAVLQAAGIRDARTARWMWSIHEAYFASEAGVMARFPRATGAARPTLRHLRRWAETAVAMERSAEYLRLYGRMSAASGASHMAALQINIMSSESAMRTAFCVAYCACGLGAISEETDLVLSAGHNVVEKQILSIPVTSILADSSWALANLHASAAVAACDPGGRPPLLSTLTSIFRVVLGAANAVAPSDTALRSALLCDELRQRWNWTEHPEVGTAAAVLQDACSRFLSHPLTPLVSSAYSAMQPDAACTLSILPSEVSDSFWWASMATTPSLRLAATASALRFEAVWRLAEHSIGEAALVDAVRGAESAVRHVLASQPGGESSMERPGSAACYVTMPLAVAVAAALGLRVANSLPARACSEALPSAALTGIVLLLEEVSKLLHVTTEAAVAEMTAFLGVSGNDEIAIRAASVAAAALGLRVVWEAAGRLRQLLLSIDCIVNVRSAGYASAAPQVPRGDERARSWTRNGSSVLAAALKLVKSLRASWTAVNDSPMSQYLSVATATATVCERLVTVEAALYGGREAAMLISRFSAVVDLTRATLWPKDSLWKHGGHPLLPPSLPVAELRASLIASIVPHALDYFADTKANLDVSAQAAMNPLPAALRQVLVDAWSTLNWLIGICHGHGQGDREEGADEVDTGLRALRVLLDDVGGRISSLVVSSKSRRLDKSELETLAGFDPAAMSDDSEIDASARAELLRLLAAAYSYDGAKLGRRQQDEILRLAPAIELWCLSWERQFQASLARVLAAVEVFQVISSAEAGQQAVAEVIDAAVLLRSWMPRLRLWLALAVAGTTWLPEQLAAYRGLLWAAEASAQRHLPTDTSRPKRLDDVAPFVAFMKDLRPTLRTTLASVLLDWEVRAWKADDSGCDFSRSDLYGTASQLDSSAQLIAAARPVHTSLRALGSSVHSSFLLSGHLGSRGAQNMPQRPSSRQEPSTLMLSDAEFAIAEALLVMTCVCFLRHDQAGVLTLQRWRDNVSSGVEDADAVAAEVLAHVRGSQDVRIVETENGFLRPAFAAVSAASCIRNLCKMNGASYGSYAVHVARATLAVSLLRVQLLLPLHPLDPAERPAAKLRACAERLAAVNDLRAALTRFYSRVSGGVGDSPLVRPLHRCDAEISQLDAIIAKCSKQVVIRGATSGSTSSLTYSGLVGMLRTFTTTLGAPAKQQRLWDWTSSPFSGAESPQNEVEAAAWLASTAAFLRGVHVQCTYFSDVAAPFGAAVAGMVAGLSLALRFRAENDSSNLLAVSQLARAAAQPCWQGDAVIASLVVRALSEVRANPADLQRDAHPAVRFATYAALAHTKGSRFVGSVNNGYATLSTLICDLTAVLVRAAEMRSAASAADDVTAGAVHRHGDVADAAAADEAAFRADFPDVSGPFAHFAPPPTPTIGDAEITPKLVVRASQSSFTQPFFEKMIDSWLLASVFVEASNAQNCSAASVEAVQAAVAAAADDLTLESGGNAGPANLRLDARVLDVITTHCALSSAGFSVLTSLLTEPLAPASQPAKRFPGRAGEAPPLMPLQKRPYHFFKDQNVGEVSVAHGPVAAVTKRALELLQQFPGNAVLLQVLRVADAIMALPVSSPLPTFVVGVNLLLGRCSEWEAHAASFVALGQPLQTLSALLTRWRALELRCWDSLLLWVDYEAERDAADLWLRLHRFLITSTAAASQRGDFVVPVTLTSSLQLAVTNATPVLRGVLLSHGWWVTPVTMPSNAPTVSPSLTVVPLARVVALNEPHVDGESENAQALVEQIFEAADRFMRSTTLGQFSARLALLNASATALSRPHSSHQAPTALAVRLSGLLFGVHAFYAQYSGMLGRARDAAVAPVVKEVRDQIKLHRWDEQTHYAAQLAAEKSHRIVHRGMRRYRDALAVPIAPLLDTAFSLEVADLFPSENPSNLSDRLGDELLAAADSVAAVEATEASSAHDDSFIQHLSSATCSLKYLSRLGPLAHRVVRFIVNARTPEAPLGSVARLRRRKTVIDLVSAAQRVTDIGALISDAKGWKTGKHGALVGLLRGTAQCGFSSNAAAIPPQLEMSRTDSMCNLLGLPEPTLVVSDDCAIVGEAKLYHKLLYSSSRGYFACIDGAIRLRTLFAAGNVHADLSPRESARLVGFANHFLATLAGQRSLLAASLSHVVTLLAALSLLDFDLGELLPGQLWGLNDEQVRAAAEMALIELDEQAASLFWAVSRLLQARKYVRSAARVLLIPGAENADVVSDATVAGILSPDDAASGSELSVPDDVLPPIISAALVQLNAAVDKLRVLLSRVDESRDSLGRLLSQFRAIDSAFLAFSGLQHGVEPKSISLMLGSSARAGIVLASQRAFHTADEVAREVMSVTSVLLPQPTRASMLESFLSNVVAVLSERLRCCALKSEPSRALFTSARTEAVDANVAGGSAPAVVSADVVGASDGACDSLVSEVLLAVQTMMSRRSCSRSAVETAAATPVAADGVGEGSATSDGPDDDDDAGLTYPPCLSQYGELVQLLQDFRLPRIIHAARAAFFSGTSSSIASQPAAWKLQLHRFLSLWVTGALGAVGDLASLHAATTEFCTRSVAVYLDLFRRGLCLPPETANADGNGGTGSKGDGSCNALGEGTGMGSGTGVQDVSKEITHEEQVLGLKGDSNDAQPPSGGAGDGGRDDTESGLHMDTDFGGELHDLPPDRGVGGDTPDDANVADEELAREMGDGSGGDGNEEVVDEKLWDGEGDDDDAEEGSKKNQGHADSSAAGGKSNKDQLRSAANEAGADGAEEEGAEAGQDSAEPLDQVAEAGNAPQPRGGSKKDDEPETRGPEHNTKPAHDAAENEDEAPDAGGGGDQADGVAEYDSAPRPREAALSMDEAEDGGESTKDDEGGDAAADVAVGDGTEQRPEDAAGSDAELGPATMRNDTERPGDTAVGELNLEEPLQLDGDAPDDNLADAEQDAGSEGDASSEGSGGGQGAQDVDMEGGSPAPIQEQSQAGPDTADPQGAPPPPAPALAQKRQQMPPAASPGFGGGGASFPAEGGAPEAQQQPSNGQPSRGRSGGPPDLQETGGAAAKDTGSADVSGEEAAEGDGAEEAPLMADESRIGVTNEAENRVGDERGDDARDLERAPEGGSIDGASGALPPRLQKKADANPFANAAVALRRWQGRLRDAQKAAAGSDHQQSVPAGSGADPEDEQTKGASSGGGDNTGAGGGVHEVGQSAAPNASDAAVTDGASGATFLLPVQDDGDAAADTASKQQDINRIPAANAKSAESDSGHEQVGDTALQDAVPTAPGPAVARDDCDVEMQGTGKSAADVAAPARDNVAQRLEAQEASSVAAEVAARDGGEGSRPLADAAASQLPEAVQQLADGGPVRSGPRRSAAAGNDDYDGDSGVAPGFGALAGRDDDTALRIAKDEEDGTALLTEDLDLATLRDQFDAALAELQSERGAALLATAQAAWAALTSLTHDASARLCEGLRLILEPTLAAKLGGEFRSGKRLNMRRIIPYIASNYRKDKIWMRRSTPSKRVYQVVLAIDDSRSMAPGNLGGGGLACEAMALLCKALARLEAGDVGVVSFGDALRVLHPLDRPFTDEAGAAALAGLTFAQDSTRAADALQGIVGLLDAAKAASPSVNSAGAGGAAVQCLQIVFLVSDGMLASGPERVRIRNWITEATARGQLIVLLIVDRAGRGSDESIASMQSIRFEGGRVVREAYLDGYPFPYYLVVRDVQQLPSVLSDAMRQWFELTVAAAASARAGSGSSGRLT